MFKCSGIAGSTWSLNDGSINRAINGRFRRTIDDCKYLWAVKWPRRARTRAGNQNYAQNQVCHQIEVDAECCSSSQKPV